MPAVTRKGDAGSGHGCFPARPSIEGSPDVFINGIPAHRKDDAWDTHCCGPVCHDGKLAAGSPTVFVNGKPLGRVGDPVDCGSTVFEGSPNVFAD
jgi:uncharacterized Zn-binding protein involved in type VI secretion